MRVRLLLFCLSFSLIQATAFAQKLKGKLMDADGKPLVGAAVLRLSEKDSSMQEGAVTDIDGEYALAQAEGGRSILRAQALGFRTRTWVVEGANGGTVRMEVTTKQLKEVEVVAQKPYVEVLPDKMVVNVAGSINAQGNNLLDLLRKSPGVMVDKDENLQLKGRQGIRVLIDGKPVQLSGSDLANYLKGLQAADVEAIELITNPSAKYEAAGSAGIINIKLKKNRSLGTNGSVSLQYAHGVFDKYNQNITLNNRTKHFNLFGNMGTYQGKNRNYFYQERTQAGVTYDQEAPSTTPYSGFNYKVGADWFINKKHTLGVLANGQHHQFTERRDASTDIGADSTGTITQLLLAPSRTSSLRNNVATNLNYRFADTLGHELTVDLDYSRFGMFRNQVTPNIYIKPGADRPDSIYAFRTKTPSQIDIYTAKADYEQKLLGGSFAAGARVSQVETKNIFDFYDTVGREDNLPFNKDRSNRYTYKERVDALYTQYRGKISDRISYHAGLRWEQTHTEGVLTVYKENNEGGLRDSIVRFTRLYDNFFPSGGVTYTLNKMNSLTLNYSRRIDRPDYGSLNPFEFKIDALTYQRGNPYLKPQYSNNFELTHTLMQMVNTSFGYGRTDGAFAQVLAKADSNKVYMQNQNMARIDNFGISISTPIPIAKWWQGFLSISGTHSVYRPTFGSDSALKTFGVTRLAVTSGNGYMQHTFILGKGYKGEVSGWGTLPGVWAGTFKSAPMGGVDIGLQKTILRDRGNIKISYSDVFYTMKWGGRSNYGGIKVYAHGSWESQQIRLSFSYRFGSDQIKGARNRASGAEDLNSRTSGGGGMGR